MTDSEEFDARPVRTFRPAAGLAVDESVWPTSVPAMAQLFREGLEVPPGLTVVRGLRPRWSYFLRADTMSQLYTYLEEHPNLRGPERLHELSHGESFLEILRTRVSETGFYLMDEPDAPLSFTGANLLELGPWGIRPASWDDLGLVVSWRQFMRDPQSFFRHLF